MGMDNANRADTQVCPYPTHLLIHDMPVGADLCVRPFVSLKYAFFLVPTLCVGMHFGRSASVNIRP